MDLRQSAGYAQYLESIGWKVEKYHKNYYFIKQLSLLGSFIKLQRPDTLKMADIAYIVKKHHAMAIVIEPKIADEKLKKNSEFIQRSPFIPSKTVLIDLKKSEQELLASCGKHTRQAIKKTVTISIKETHDIALFKKQWQKATKGKRHIPKIKQLESFVHSFKKDCIMLMDSEGHAGALFVATKNTAYYWHGFTDEVGRKSLVQYQILWQGMLWGKARGKSLFDMEGIYDPRFPMKGWEGFSHFKKGFGGKQIEFPGAFIKYFGIWKYIPIF